MYICAQRYTDTNKLVDWLASEKIVSKSNISKADFLCKQALAN